MFIIAKAVPQMQVGNICYSYLGDTIFLFTFVELWKRKC